MIFKERFPINSKDHSHFLSRGNCWFSPRLILVERPDRKPRSLGDGQQGARVDSPLSHDPSLDVSSNESRGKIG